MSKVIALFAVQNTVDPGTLVVHVAEFACADPLAPRVRDHRAVLAQGVGLDTFDVSGKRP